MFQISFNRVSCEKKTGLGSCTCCPFFLFFFCSLELIISVGRDQEGSFLIQADNNAMVPWAKILQTNVEVHFQISGTLCHKCKV